MRLPRNRRSCPLAKTAAIESYELEELCRSIETFYGDRERRNRLYHDEWYVSLLETPGVPATRGVQRKDGAVVWGDSTPSDVWELARRFRDYRVGSLTSCTSCKSRRAPSRFLMIFRINANRPHFPRRLARGATTTSMCSPTVLP